MRQQSRIRSLALACGLVALVLVLAGCDLGATSGNATVPTPLPTITPLPTPLATATPGGKLPAFSGSLDPAPARCPASPALQTYETNNFGGGFSGDTTFDGRKPAWQLGLGSTVNLTRGPDGYYATKVMWVVGPNYNQPVTLTAPSVRGGPSLWFDVYPPNGGYGASQDIYGTRAVLDPGAPNRGGTDNSTGHWNIWGIGMIALSAGCYDLIAAWAGGSWHTILAVGS